MCNCAHAPSRLLSFHLIPDSDSLTNHSFAWLQIVTQSQTILSRGYRWWLTHKPFFAWLQIVTHKPFFRVVTDSDSITNHSFSWLQMVTHSQTILRVVIDSNSQTILSRGYRWWVIHKPFFRVVTDGESFTNHSFAWLVTDSDSLIYHSSRGYR